MAFGLSGMTVLPPPGGEALPDVRSASPAMPRFIHPGGLPAIGRCAVRAQHDDRVKPGDDAKRLSVGVAPGSGDLAWGPPRFSEGGPSGNGTNLVVSEQPAADNGLVRICSPNSTDAA